MLSLAIMLRSFKKLKTKHSDNGFSNAGRNKNPYTTFKREEKNVNRNKEEVPDREKTDEM